jgi:hypothetical protein
MFSIFCPISLTARSRPPGPCAEAYGSDSCDRPRARVACHPVGHLNRSSREDIKNKQPLPLWMLFCTAEPGSAVNTKARAAGLIRELRPALDFSEGVERVHVLASGLTPRPLARTHKRNRLP